MHHAAKPVTRFLATLCLLLGLNEAALAARPQVFTSMDRSKVAAPRFDIKSDATPIAIDRKKIAALAQNDEMDLALPDGKSFVVTFDRVEDHGGGIFSRVGYLREHGNNFRVILTSGPGGTFGSIITPDTHYRVVPGNGSDWLVDMTEENVHVPFINLGDDYRRVPLSAESARKKFEPVQSETQRLAQDSPQVSIGQQTPAPVTIDLMIVYTNGLAARLGTSMMTRFYNLVTAANLAYADSQIGINLRLVHATQVNYTDDLVAKPNGAVLDDITPGRPEFNAAIFGHIEGLRTTVGADLVAVLRSGQDSGGSGLAWLTQENATTFSSLNNNYMYSVTTGCVVGCDSVFIHEMGHNMGNAHDRATEAVQQGGIASPQAGAYPYSFGHYVCATGALSCNAFGGGCGVLPQCSDTTTNPRYVNPNNIGTIMSYFNPVTLKFSNPNVSCTQPGVLGGASYPCGVANTIDNARSMNNMRTVVSNVKATTVNAPTGAIQFSTEIYTTQESAGSVLITVKRVGGSGGAVSVNYSTQDASAKAGFDYVGTSGTLNWAAGDAADKTFTVNLVNDGVAEGLESFNVVLSNPTGATGIFLGFPSTAAIQLTESVTWPPGGTFPVGYTSTTTNSASTWSVENVAANCDTGQAPCLVSPQVLSTATNFQTYDYSDLVFTTPANTPAGTISFTYHVSSLSTSFANLQFLIGNTVVFSSAGGDTGWLPTSVSFSGGAQTIRWRFQNRVYFQCSTAVDPVPPANCRDRAWIDNVTIPVALTASSTALVSSANPSIAGSSVTFTATATGSAGTPAGVVTFRDAGTVITGCNLVALSSGVATCTTSTLTNGTHSITASYSGNSVYDTSVSNTISQAVNGIPVVLTVGKSGAGTGTVTGTGINCGVDCTESVGAGTVVVLTAAPAIGSSFAGWSGGGCTGTGTCSVTVSADTTVTANFILGPHQLIVSRTGTGSGTVTGTGINCGVDCTESVANNTVVALTATPAGDSSFAGWSGGGCTGTGTCNVTLTAATTVTATFTLLPVTLTVAKAGNGSGTVSGTGISCGADCTESVAPGTVVALTATPTAGSNFTGWSGGGCTGTGACNVTVSAATTVTANFTLQTFTLTSAKSGTGTGTITGTGFSCGADCSEVVNFGTVVVLTATPDGTSSFAGWSGGGCSGTGTCSVTVSAATTVTATFTLLPVTLTVATAGNGTGSVAGTGISCPGDCTESVAPGTVIALTATPGAGSNFTGWSGGGCSGTGVCNVTVSAATSVTATFTLQTFTLTLTRSGAGTGTVTSSPAGIACGATCSSVFNFGTVVALTASPAVGSTFTGWSGGGCSGTGSCNVTVSAAATVNAVFAIATNPPGAPTSVSATAGNALALVSFAAPLSDGGSPVTSYTATCGAATPVSGASAPITVTGLANGVAVTCSVTATNVNGTGPGATSNSVTPSAGAAIALSSVVSRKSHGAAGNQDLTVAFATPLAGAITVEPRTNSSGHTLRFTFNVPVTSVGTATVTDGTNAIGTASASADGSNVVTVTLTGVPDNRRAQVSVNNVNGSFLAQANVGFLVGDVTGNGKVNATDLSAIKARNGQSATTAAIYDIKGSGTVDITDVAAAKARSGQRLP